MNRFITDTKRYFKYAVYAAKAELKSEVANSYLNWIWWVLEPVCTMLIYIVIFQGIFQTKQQYFPIFIYIGLTFWTFFNKNVVTNVKLVQMNKSLVSKVYIPKFILILSKLFVNGFKMLISFIIVIILMVISRVHITWHVLETIPLFFLLVILTYAFSTILLHIGVYVEDMQYVVSILLKFVFYLTGIFYDIDTRLSALDSTIGAPLSVIMGKINPMAYIITDMRNCLIYEKGVDWRFYLFWLAVSIILAFFGTKIIYKNENSYIKVI